MSKLDRIVGYVAVVCFFGSGACFIFAGCGMLWNALFGEDQAIRNTHSRDAFGVSIGDLEKRMVARQDGSYAPARGFGDELKPAVTDWHSANTDLYDGKRDVPDVRDDDGSVPAHARIPCPSDDRSRNVPSFFPTNGAAGVVGRRAGSNAGKDGPGGNGNLNGIDFHAANYTKSL